MFFELFYVVENDDTLNASFQRSFFIGARTNTLLHYNAVVLNVRYVDWYAIKINQNLIHSY